MDYVKAASELRQMLVAVENATSQVVALGMYSDKKRCPILR